MQQQTVIRLSIIAGLTLFIGLIIGAIYMLVSQSGKVQVVITAYPEDSTVLIDSKKTSQKQPYLTPGKHTFTATKSGFADDSQTVIISDQSKSIILLPAPTSADATSWAQRADVAARRETLGSELANQRGDYLSEQYPLISKLPRIDINGPFALDYGYTGQNNSELYFIIHDSTPDGRQAAFTWLRGQGVDPATLDIRYSEYQNPLTKGGV